MGKSLNYSESLELGTIWKTARRQERQEMCLKPKSLGLGKWFSPRVSTCPASMSPTFNPQRPHDVLGTGTKAETGVPEVPA